MRPLDLQQIGEELAIKWEDGSEDYIPLRTLRLGCPCAGCKGEVDVMGHLHKGPEQQLGPFAFRLSQIASVGGYAIQPHWADGHASGLYPFEYLKRLAVAK